MVTYRVYARARGAKRREYMEAIEAESAKEAVAKMKKLVGKSFAKLYTDWNARKLSRPRRRALFAGLRL